MTCIRKSGHEGAHARDLEHAAQAFAQWSRSRAGCAAIAPSSRTTIATSAAQTTTSAATARKVARQPIVALAQASGAVTSSVPMVPIADLDAGQHREPLGRKAARIERERRHQVAGRAEPHQDARRDQPGRRRGDREQQRAREGDRRADQHAALRPVAVERDAERNLRGREGEEEGARQQADLAGRQPDLGARSGAMTPTELRRNWLTR